MRIKLYEVTLRHEGQDNETYWVDAPNKWIAKWCGANLFNHKFKSFCKAKDMRAKRLRLKDIEKMLEKMKGE